MTTYSKAFEASAHQACSSRIQNSLPLHTDINNINMFFIIKYLLAESSVCKDQAVIEYLRLQREETSNIVRFKEYLISTRENGL
jgi:hypothetical protein